MRRGIATVFAVLLLGGAACGDSSDDQDPPPRGEDAVETTVTVRATDFAFDPTVVEVDPGQTGAVTFVNAGNVAHTFTAEDLDVDVEAETGGEINASFTAPDEATTIEFVCRFHPSQMTGEIVVGDGGSGGGGSGGGGSGGGGSGESDDFDY